MDNLNESDYVTTAIYNYLGNIERHIKIHKKVHDLLSWLAQQYASTFKMHIGANMIEDDLKFVDVVNRNYIVDSKMRVHKIQYSFQPHTQRLSLDGSTQYDIFSKELYPDTPTPYYDGTTSSPKMVINVPKVSRVIDWDHVRIVVDPLFDIKCQTQITFAEGMLICEKCKEVWV